MSRVCKLINYPWKIKTFLLRWGKDWVSSFTSLSGFWKQQLIPNYAIGLYHGKWERKKVVLRNVSWILEQITKKNRTVSKNQGNFAEFSEIILKSQWKTRVPTFSSMLIASGQNQTFIFQICNFEQSWREAKDLGLLLCTERMSQKKYLKIF